VRKNKSDTEQDHQGEKHSGFLPKDNKINLRRERHMSNLKAPFPWFKITLAPFPWCANIIG